MGNYARVLGFADLEALCRTYFSAAIAARINRTGGAADLNALLFAVKLAPEVI